jgi:hypothetical protein
MAQSEGATGQKKCNFASPYPFTNLYGIRNRQAAGAAFASVGCFGNPVYGVPTGKYSIGILTELGAKRYTSTAACTDLAITDILPHLGHLAWVDILSCERSRYGHLPLFLRFEALHSDLLISSSGKMWRCKRLYGDCQCLTKIQ